MKRHPYLEILFKDYPVLFVNEYSEITKELLEKTDYLFQQAQEINLGKLTLPYFYDSIIESVIKKEIK